jgi:hypothetical protein
MTMRREFSICLLLGTLAIWQVGCESRKVVEPAGDGAVVVEEEEAVIEEPATEKDADADVNVNVGGGEGVKVDVDKDANP